MHNELYTLILGIVTLVLCFIAAIGLIYIDLISAKKRKEYVKQLNDHDSKVVHDYINGVRVTIDDFKSKKKDKEVKDENI